MTSLFTTKYPNNIRTVTGPITDGLYKDDSVILCDTSLGAITINLDEIPADYWNTTAKIYISDISNNAAVNNITIVAPTGFKINNASSLVIDTSGGGAVIRVLNNTNYQATLNYCCGSGSAGFVTLLNAALLALIASATIVPGTYYLVTDILNADTGVIVMGTSTITVELEGDGLFLNADYRNVSGVNRGVWRSTLAGLVANVSIAIWNGLHYKNLTGAVGTAPSGDATNWLVMAKSTANTYIQVSDFVKYNPVSNLVIYRADVFDNEVEYYNDGKGNEAIALFQWGNFGTGQGAGQCARNKVFSQGILDCINNYKYVLDNIVCQGSSITARDNAGTIQYNKLIGASEITSGSNTVNSSIVDNFLSCASQFLLAGNTAAVSKNNISGGAVVTYTNNTKTFFNNTISQHAAVTLTGNTGIISYCKMCADLSFDFSTNVSDITSKRCESGFSNFEKTLNLDDITIYDVGLERLTLPTFSDWVGIYNLYNVGEPKTILSILNLSSNHVTTFKCLDTYSAIFQNSAMPASAYQLVCDAGTSSNALTGRANGNDFIQYQLSGNLNVRTNVVVLS